MDGKWFSVFSFQFLPQKNTMTTEEVFLRIFVFPVFFCGEYFYNKGINNVILWVF